MRPPWRMGVRAAAALLLLCTQGGCFTAIPPPPLDLSSLGSVGLVGDFDAISVYSYQGQVEGYRKNGAESILSQLPNGAFQTLASTDASIRAMCPFVLMDGTLAGVVVGGNFTSIGGVDATGVALFNATSNSITPLPGIHGSVSALLCAKQTNTVYVGGSFQAANSTNAIAWVGTTGWANLPFAGFNAPVTSITQAPNGHIVFGGAFTGLGNMSAPSPEAPQFINLVTAAISSQGNDAAPDGLGNPQNILCPSNSTNGASTPWLLDDGTPGFWRADMQYGYIPSKVRLWNSNYNGRGTKTWRFIAHPINGIMNLTYDDPTTGQKKYCDANCPLAQNSSLPYQDFTFVNQVGMNSFQIDISDWYGAGAGLTGIQLFQNNIFAYAVNAFNEPTCSGLQFPSNATTTGSWTTMPSAQSELQYLGANVDTANANSASVIFQPDIRSAANYTVTVFTPGCIQDGSCNTRGRVQISGTLTAGAAKAFSTILYQTNNFDKYDDVYLGSIDACSEAFRPAVTLTPVQGQGTVSVVASRIEFTPTNTTSGLNGLFEYNPNQAVVDMDFSKSAINSAGTMLNPNAQVEALLTRDQTLYAAGDFSDDTLNNIMSFSNNKASPLPGGGLNAPVAALLSLGDFLYVGGNFSNTKIGNIKGLSNVAAYQFSKNAWVALDSGLDGPVETIVPIQLNISQNKPETTVAFSGSFTHILADGSSIEPDAAGLAIWVPSHNNWLQNLNIPQQYLAGQLCAATDVPNGPFLVAGTLASAGEAISGAVELTSSTGKIGLEQFPIHIARGSYASGTTKRAESNQQSVSGVVAGAYYDNGGRNVTILGGHFSATATNGSTIRNLLFLNGSNHNIVTGAPPGIEDNSTFLSLDVQGDSLFAGGLITGDIGGSRFNGLIVYDLFSATYRSPQPAALVGTPVAVNAIATRPDSTQVYVAGAFQGTAQGLQCPTVCMYDTSADQWNPVGSNIQGQVVSLFWSSSTTMMAIGNLTIGANSTSLGVTTSLATYDVNQQTWTSDNTSFIPGQVTAFAPAISDGSEFWMAGTAKNRSTFLTAVKGNNYYPFGEKFGVGTDIRGLQVISLTQSHTTYPYLDGQQSLMITGALTLPKYGDCAAALFDGENVSPFILASTSSGGAGSISQLFSSKTNTLKSSSKLSGADNCNFSLTNIQARLVIRRALPSSWRFALHSVLCF